MLYENHNDVSRELTMEVDLKKSIERTIKLLGTTTKLSSDPSFTQE